MRPQHLLLDGAVGAGLLLALGLVFALDRPSPPAPREIASTPAPQPAPKEQPPAPKIKAPPKKEKKEETKPVAPPKIEVIEKTEVVSKPRPLKLAVSTPVHDDIGQVLQRLGKGYSYTQLTDRELEKAERLSEFDVVFLTCGTGGAIERLQSSLREFVRKGGTLYASDLRYPTVALAFPEYVDPFNLGAGRAGIQRAQVVDPGLRDLLGEQVDLNFNLAGWAYAGFKKGQDVTVYLRMELPGLLGGRSQRPLLVKFPFEKGVVIFTSFHNAKINNETAEKLLRYLVFSAVTAEERTRVTTTMLKGGFSPQKESLFSTSDGAEAITQTYQHRKSGPLKFALAFKNQGARLRLTVTSPSGTKKQMEGNSTFVIDVPDAGMGAWTYTVTALRVPFPNFPFSVTIGQIVPKE